MSHMKEVEEEKEDVDQPKQRALMQLLHFSHSDSRSTIIVVIMQCSTDSEIPNT